MSHPLQTTRPASRPLRARLPAYAAFAVSVAFAASIIFGLVG